MATTTDDLVVRVIVDSGGAKKGSKEVAISLNKVTKESKEADKAVKDASKSFSKFGAVTIALNQGLELAGKAYKALIGPVKEATAAFAVQEKAESKLANALALTSGFTKEAFQDFKDFASGLQEVSTVGDEATLELLAVAKSMGLTNEKAKTLAVAAADLSAATGKGLKQSFDTLLQTTGGLAGRLGLLIPELKGLTEEELKAGGAIDIVAKKFQGFAKADIKNFSGALQQAKNSIGDAFEEVGKLIVEGFDLPTVLGDVKDFVNNLIGEIGKLRPVFDGIREVMKSLDFKALADQAAVFGAALLAGILPVIAPTALVALKFAAIGIAIVGVVGAIDILIKNFDNLGAVGDTLASIFLSVFERIKRGFKGLMLLLQLGLEKLLEPIAGTMFDVGGAAEHLLGSVRKAQIDLSDSIDESNQQIEKTDMALSEVQKTVDKGFLGEIFEQGANAADVFNKTFGESNDQLKEANKLSEKLQSLLGKKGKDTKPAVDPKVLQEQVKTAQALTAEVEKQKIAFEAAGAVGFEAIDKQRDAQLKLLDIRRKNLEAENKLNDAGRKQLELKEDQIKKEAEAAKAQRSKELTNVVSDQQLANITDSFSASFGEGGAMIGESIAGGLGAASGVVGALAGPIGAAAAGANAVLDAVQGLIDLIPQLLSKIANIFNSLTELPLKIAEGVSDVVKSIVKLIAELIPNLLQAVPDILDTLITGLFEQIPMAFMQLLDNLPELIQGLVDRIPELSEKFMIGAISNAPKLAIALAKFLIKDAPKISIAISKTLATELPKAIVKGIEEGINEVLAAIQGVFGGGGGFNVGVDEKQVTDAFKQVEKTATSIGESVFKVLDLEAAATGTRTADDISKAIDGSTSRAKNILQRIFDFLKGIWDGVRDFLRPVFDFLKGIWDGVIGFFTDTIGPIIAGAWQAIIAFFTETLPGLISSAWSAIIEFIQSLPELVSSAWQGVMDFFGGLMNFITNDLPGVVAGAFRFLIKFWTEDLPGVVSGAFKFLIKFWTKDLPAIISSAFKFIITFWTKDLPGAITKAFKGIVDFWTKELPAFIGTAFNAVFDFFNKIFQGKIDEAFKGLFDFFKNDLLGFVGKAFDPILNLGKDLFDAFTKPLENFNFGQFGSQIWESLKSGLGGIGTIFKTAIENLNPGNILQKAFKIDFKGKGTVEKLINLDVPWANFASGGMVPGTAVVNGDSEMNDRVLALLSPGERVIPRSISQDPVLGKAIDKIVSGDFIRAAFGVKVSTGGVQVGSVKVGNPDAGKTLATANVAVPKVDTSNLKIPSPAGFKDKIIDKITEGIQNQFSGLKMADGGFVSGDPFPVADFNTAVDLFSNSVASGGSQSSGQQTFNFNINVSTNQKVDARDLIRRAKESIREDSIDGRFVMSGNGLRDTA